MKLDQTPTKTRLIEHAYVALPKKNRMVKEALLNNKRLTDLRFNGQLSVQIFERIYMQPTTRRHHYLFVWMNVEDPLKRHVRLTAVCMYSTCCAYDPGQEYSRKTPLLCGLVVGASVGSCLMWFCDSTNSFLFPFCSFAFVLTCPILTFLVVTCPILKTFRLQA
jgi:hypothetical protein